MTTFPQPEITAGIPIPPPEIIQIVPPEAFRKGHGCGTHLYPDDPAIQSIEQVLADSGCKWKPGTPAHDKHCVPEPSAAILLAIGCVAAMIFRHR